MEAYYSFIDTTEKVLTPLGLMEGESAVPKRMLAGAVVGGIVVALLKPDSMFENGTPRPWSFTAGSGPTQGPKPTTTPWFIVPALGAIFLGLFV
jgi:hypothetical protein